MIEEKPRTRPSDDDDDDDDDDDERRLTSDERRVTSDERQERDASHHDDTDAPTHATDDRRPTTKLNYILLKCIHWLFF
jgi:hypothetical protein